MQTVGERIKELRKKHWLTQQDLSIATQIHSVQISRYENNQTMPTCETLSRIAEVLDTSMDYLAGLTDDEKPYPRTNLKE